jgi:hypothetical protein
MPRRRSQRRRTNKRVRGGAGTASWAPYGLADQQSRGGEGNLIASVKVGGGVANLSPSMVGGKQQKQQQGAGVLNDIALPAMLIYANNAYGRGRSNGSTFRRRSRRRGRFSRRR